jgi:hypothetical protein
MNSHLVYRMFAGAAVGATVAMPARALALRCPPDSVEVGDVCIGISEASVWQISPSNPQLVRLVHAGRATLADLTGGATEVSPASTCRGATRYLRKSSLDTVTALEFARRPHVRVRHRASDPGERSSIFDRQRNLRNAATLSDRGI